MSNEAIYWGTGRRKNAVARVHIVPGTGKVTVNKRDAVEYFGRQQLVDMDLMPLKVTETEGHFDVDDPSRKQKRSPTQGEAPLVHKSWR